MTALRPFTQCAFPVLLALLWTACASNPPVDFTAPALWEKIQSDHPPTIVDVRSAGEYESGHIPGAIHIPFWAVWSRTDKITTPPDHPIVVYCEHGPRAVMAKFAFHLAGFREIMYLQGDMTGWKAAKLPLEPAVDPL